MQAKHIKTLKYGKVLEKHIAHKDNKKSSAWLKTNILHIKTLCIYLTLFFIVIYIYPLKLNKNISNFITYIKTDYFALRNIECSGNKNLSNEEILSNLGIKLGDNLLNHSADNIKHTIETNPEIKTADVKIILPNTLSIKITEKIPAAIWWKNREFYLIDQEGTIIKKIDSTETGNNKDFLVVIGADANLMFLQTQKILKNSNIYKQIYSIQLIGKRRWNLLLHNGTIIKLPDNNMPKALEILDDLLKNKNINNQLVHFIDLRLIPDKIYIKF